MMKQVNWFDRTFAFSFEQNIFPSIIERLEGTPLRLKNKISRIPSEQLVVKRDNSWSIQENVGHLIDLEPLWQGRLDDILNGKEYLRSTDLENKQTDSARHNETVMEALLTKFHDIRHRTVEQLKGLSEEQVYQSALHPRLKTPMRAMDLFLFVAEHDDHHLARISELRRLLAAKV